MPREKKQPTLDDVMDDVQLLKLEDLLSLAKNVAAIISDHQKEAEEKLNLIRNGGK